MKTICTERWFQITERLPRPLTVWGFSILAVGYGARAVIGLPFDEMTFGALAAAAGFTFFRRGQEKLKHKELEE